jgi:4-aminobutyrate aminotransferase-like enzyme/Ser/Thr protein kinase RdoA (MazF antagonist)
LLHFKHIVFVVVDIKQLIVIVIVIAVIIYCNSNTIQTFTMPFIMLFFLLTWSFSSIQHSFFFFLIFRAQNSTVGKKETWHRKKKKKEENVAMERDQMEPVDVPTLVPERTIQFAQSDPIYLSRYEMNRKPIALIDEGSELDIELSLSELQDLFKCAVCRSVIENATTVMGCMHRFCDRCVQTWFRNQPVSDKTCPLCRFKSSTRRNLRADEKCDELVQLIFGDVGEFKRAQQERVTRELEAIRKQPKPWMRSASAIVSANASAARNTGRQLISSSTPTRSRQVARLPPMSSSSSSSSTKEAATSHKRDGKKRSAMDTVSVANANKRLRSEQPQQQQRRQQQQEEEEEVDQDVEQIASLYQRLVQAYRVAAERSATEQRRVAGAKDKEPLANGVERCRDDDDDVDNAEASKVRVAELMRKRAELMCGAQRIHYQSSGDALYIERGFGAYLFDDRDTRYLDMVNNVCHVGHSHPAVVNAAATQMALLNTNTRYVHEAIVDYAGRLTSLMPAPLCVAFFVNSASEAVELALRLARAATMNARGLVCLEHSYHGHTGAALGVSPYKFLGRGGEGAPAHVRVAPMPDTYKGRYVGANEATAARYAADAGALAGELARDSSLGLAAFIAEPMPSVAGHVVLPPTYLRRVYDMVRAAGGVCICDETQVGFGRLGPGDHFWGFASQGVVPDIVTLGKPIGNGFPLGAVVTTRAVADAFNNGMEFFSTFGGSPVAMRVGLSVLDVVEREQLAQRAQQLGARLRTGLDALRSKCSCVGDVRGSGLFVGVELVRGGDPMLPATQLAEHVSLSMKRRFRILVGVEGPGDNVLKIKPPLAIGAADIDAFVSALGRVLAACAMDCHYGTLRWRIDLLGARECRRPSVTPAQCVDIMRHRYANVLPPGARILSVFALDSYDDLNFRVDVAVPGVAAPRSFVLKVANHSVDYASLAVQNLAMAHARRAVDEANKRALNRLERKRMRQRIEQQQHAAQALEAAASTTAATTTTTTTTMLPQGLLPPQPEIGMPPRSAEAPQLGALLSDSSPAAALPSLSLTTSNSPPSSSLLFRNSSPSSPQTPSPLFTKPRQSVSPPSALLFASSPSTGAGDGESGSSSSSSSSSSAAEVAELVDAEPMFESPVLLAADDGRTIVSDSATGGCYVRLLTYVSGTSLLKARIADEPGKNFAFRYGVAVARLCKSLIAGFDAIPAAATRFFAWNIQNVDVAMSSYGQEIAAEHRKLVHDVFTENWPKFIKCQGSLRVCMTHNDLNHSNCLFDMDKRRFGFIDFGDVTLSFVVVELAVAVAYATMERASTAARPCLDIVAGFEAVLPLTGVELQALWPIVCLRVCLSVAHSSHASLLAETGTQRDYILSSQRSALGFLRVIAKLDFMAHYRSRERR